MGEGAEQTPMAIISGAPKVHFLTRPPTTKEEKSVKISMKKDLYSPHGSPLVKEKLKKFAISS
jgi:F420-0:gamma-glutamyl ligase